MWYQDPDTGQWRRVGGTGWGNCYPGTQCFQEVSAACTQKCNACLAAGGVYGGSGGEPTYRACSDESCSIPTGWTNEDPPQATSVCSDFCACASEKFCRDTQIVGGGNLSTQNSACKCPD